MSTRFYAPLTAGLGIMFISLLICCSSGKEPLTLKEKFQDDFKIGAAIGAWELFGRDSTGLQLVTEQFSAVTTTNEMKWERIHPNPGEYRFRASDTFIEYGQENGMYIVGHTLIWHSQTPKWVFVDSLGNPATREAMLARMEDHITSVMTRYKGKVDCWDVVNEAVSDDGTMRKNTWYDAVGPDYVEMAFRYAMAADPDATLIYNDYSMDGKQKREGVVRMVKSLKEKGVKIDGIGMQAHYSLDEPGIADIEESIIAFSELGVKVSITELDISVLPSPWGRIGADISISKELRNELNPYPEMLPDSMQVKLANRYKELFELFVRHSKNIERVTFWGVTDKTSWKNNFPMRGRTNYPLLFDRNYEPKPAYYSVMGVKN